MLLLLILNLKIKFNSTAAKSAVEGKKMVNPLILLVIVADNTHSACDSSEKSVGCQIRVIRHAMEHADQPYHGRV